MSAAGLRLHCFGKLPWWREYLTVGGSSRPARRFKEWVQSGRAAWLEAVADATGGAGSAAPGAETGSWRFLIGPSMGGGYLAGCIVPSEDAQGRRFPFLTFVEIPRWRYWRTGAALPLVLGPTWTACEQAARELRGGSDIAGLERDVAARSIPAPEAASAARSRLAAALASDASHVRGAGGAELSIPTVAGGLQRVVEWVQTGDGRGPRLDLPVATRLDRGARDASFWIEVVTRAFRWRRPCPSVFIEAHPDERERRALLIYGAFESADYALLFTSVDKRVGVLRAVDPPPPRPRSSDSQSLQLADVRRAIAAVKEQAERALAGAGGSPAVAVAPAAAAEPADGVASVASEVTPAEAGVAAPTAKPAAIPAASSTATAAVRVGVKAEPGVAARTAAAPPRAVSRTYRRLMEELVPAMRASS